MVRAGQRRTHILALDTLCTFDSYRQHYSPLVWGSITRTILLTATTLTVLSLVNIHPRSKGHTCLTSSLEFNLLSSVSSMSSCSTVAASFECDSTNLLSSLSHFQRGLWSQQWCCRLIVVFHAQPVLSVELAGLGVAWTSKWKPSFVHKKTPVWTLAK